MEIDNEELHYSKVEKSKDGHLQFERGLVIQKDFTWNIYCKESKILPDCDICSSIPKIISSLSSFKFALQMIDSCALCVRNSDEKFTPLVKQRKGIFTNASGKLEIEIHNNYDSVLQVQNKWPFMMLRKDPFSLIIVLPLLLQKVKVVVTHVVNTGRL